MERAELIKVLSERLKITPAVAEQTINEVVTELVSPYVFRQPGEQVGLLDNSCTNNCKEPPTVVRAPTRGR